MESSAKIQLSPQELELVQNTAWLVTKRIITKKVYDMFGDISIVLKDEISSSTNILFPENIKHKTGKISQEKITSYFLMLFLIILLSFGRIEFLL